jgi:hypothetical protein
LTKSNAFYWFVCQPHDRHGDDLRALGTAKISQRRSTSPPKRAGATHATGDGEVPCTGLGPHGHGSQSDSLTIGDAGPKFGDVLGQGLIGEHLGSRLRLSQTRVQPPLVQARRIADTRPAIGKDAELAPEAPDQSWQQIGENIALIPVGHQVALKAGQHWFLRHAASNKPWPSGATIPRVLATWVFIGRTHTFPAAPHHHPDR